MKWEALNSKENLEKSSGTITFAANKATAILHLKLIEDTVSSFFFPIQYLVTAILYSAYIEDCTIYLNRGVSSKLPSNGDLISSLSLNLHLTSSLIDPALLHEETRVKARAYSFTEMVMANAFRL